MESSAIILSIEEIYERFSVMPSLKKHMTQVAGVAEQILLKESSRNKDDVIAALLLHDLGNIVKFKLEEFPHWKEVQQEIIIKYGSNDNAVTKKMIYELGVNDRVAFLVCGMKFENLQQVIDSNDRELKICLYADLKVAPYGIVSIQERFADLRKRYKDTPLESRYDSFQEERALLLEQQVLNRKT